MVTAIQARVAASRLKDPSYQRALINRAREGNISTAGMGLDTSVIQNVPVAITLSQKSTQDIMSKIVTKTPEVNNMATAGQDLTMYQQLDTMLGGLLPGGVEPTAGGVTAATRIIGAATGTALAVGAGYAAYKYFTKDGKERKIRKDGKPYDKPSMNYANPKALARAERRMKSYIKHARKHVSAMGYAIKRRGSD